MSAQILQTLATNAIYSAWLFAIVLPLGWLLRNRSPQLRHALWTIVLLRLVLPPSLQLPVSAWNAFDTLNQATAKTVELTITASPIAASGSASQTPLVLLAIWLFGVLLVSGIMLRSRSQLWALVREARRVDSPRVLLAFARAKQRLGIDRHVELVSSNEQYGAFTIGTLRPYIYIPDRVLSNLSEASLECLIAHELVHIKRLDDLSRQAQALLMAIYFFYPVAWLTGALRNRENELVCDGLAISRGNLEPSTYGRSILDVLRLGASPHPHTAMFIGRRQTLKQRIESAFNARPVSHVLQIGAIALAFILLPMSGTPLTGATLEPMASPPPSTAEEPLRVEDDVVAPKVVKKIQPVYPDEARKEGLQGVTLILATIDTDGNVTDMETLESTRDDFTEAARDAVRQWKFEPATLEGEKVAVLFQLTVRFRLK